MSPIMLLLPVLLPILGGAAMFVLPAQNTKQREVYVQLFTCATSILVAVLLWNRPSGTAVVLDMGNVQLALRLDSLSVVFAAILAVLWPLGLTGLWINFPATSALAAVLALLILRRQRPALHRPDAS